MGAPTYFVNKTKRQIISTNSALIYNFDEIWGLMKQSDWSFQDEIFSRQFGYETQEERDEFRKYYVIGHENELITPPSSGIDFFDCLE